MNQSKISYMVMSDIHLGHPQIPSDQMIDAIMVFFNKHHNTLKKLDIIFLAGDVYHKLLSTTSIEFLQTVEWLSLLSMYCRKHDIMLRVLEGTSSHDRKQMSVFSKILNKLDIDIDYKYIDCVYIEKNAQLGINILYVPDNVNEDASDTMVDVMRVMDIHGIDKVDIAIMHGQFRFQLPMVDMPCSHSEDNYLNIVKYYINPGHIHTSMVYKRILGQGSFGRYNHGEEEDKGCMIMNIHSTGDMDFKFLVNTEATPHKKYDLTNLNTSDVIKYLSSKLSKLKLGTRVKLVISNNEVNALLTPLKDRFKDIIFKVEKERVKEDRVIKNNKVIIKPFEITPENIVGLINNELSKYELNSGEMSILDTELSNHV